MRADRKPLGDVDAQERILRHAGRRVGEGLEAVDRDDDPVVARLRREQPEARDERRRVEALGAQVREQPRDQVRARTPTRTWW